MSLSRPAPQSNETDLHWSVDYTYQPTERDFGHEFSQTLACALALPPIDRDAEIKVHRYALLPNFWSGYKRALSGDPSLNIGSVTVERARRDRAWQYRVEHVNTTSGEELTLAFTCDDGPARGLRAPWRIHTQNGADGSYASISWSGTSMLVDGRRTIVLTTERGLSFGAGTVPPDATVTCNWALLDILPALRDGSLDRLAILEDLEMLRVDCRIQPLKEWTFLAGSDRHRLSGYSVCGTGLSPSYWWLTEEGDVAAIATTFATYVLREREG